MKQILFCLVALLIAGAGTAVAAEVPVAEVPEPVYEFESVLDGDQVVHDFVIRNDGAAMLEIARIKTG